MQISVIIPTYNRAQLIREAVESVIGQDFSDWELLIIDDGSTDNTREIVGKYGKSVKYVHQENAGPSAARNRGMSCAGGKYIAFLDADDVWLPEKLAIQNKLMENSRSAGIVATGYYVCDRDLNVRETVIRKRKKVRRRDLLVKNTILTSSVLGRRECILEGGLFNERYRFGEDWDMWLRIASRFEIAYVQEPLCKYRVHSDSITLGMDPRNLEDWRDIIKRSRKSVGSPRELALSNKSLGWFYFNVSYFHQCRNDKKSERKYLAMSLFYWPFDPCKRYIAFLRTLMDDSAYFRMRNIFRKRSAA